MHELLAAGMFACLHRVSDKGSRLQRNRWFKQGSQTTLAEFQVFPSGSAFLGFFPFPLFQSTSGLLHPFPRKFQSLAVLLPCWVLELTFLVLVWGSSLLSRFFGFFFLFVVFFLFVFFFLFGCSRSRSGLTWCASTA